MKQKLDFRKRKDKIDIFDELMEGRNTIRGRICRNLKQNQNIFLYPQVKEALVIIDGLSKAWNHLIKNKKISDAEDAGRDISK